MQDDIHRQLASGAAFINFALPSALTLVPPSLFYG